MIKISLQLTNQLGLHARASAKFVATASKYLSKIDVCHGKHTVNGKSIMGIMMIGAKCGSQIDCTIDGEDETELAKALKTLLANKFDEEE
ncbi:MAG: HPr family phosphocarrier protein [Gammaproteobacteria bacterium]|jgi:phosphocarrier protein HPr|nr:HPr family phosphocarrier protein [Gammaproteobacteria bacterium]